jgi:putative ABC transport system permease protein
VNELLRLVSVRHMRSQKTRTLLTLIGIALGIAVVFAINIVNDSVLSSFTETIDTIAGKTALSVGEGNGVAEEVLEQVQKVEGVEAAVPVIEESARDVKTGTQFAVLGIDTLSDSKVRDYDVTARDVQIDDELTFLNDPHGVLVTKAFAKSAKLGPDATLTLETSAGRSDFNVRGTLEPRGPAKVFGGDLLVMDVYAAQVAFERGRRFDRIDVVPKPGVDVAQLEARLGKVLKGKAEIGKPKRRSEEAQRILAGFKLGLQLASFVAIFVGAFIIYNALAIAVAQRRREVGILRALGTRRSQVLLLFLGEGLLMGLLGSLLGLGLGILLARSVLDLVGGTVTALFLTVKPAGLTLTSSQVVLGVSIGVGAAFAASLLPAWRASVIEPAVAMRKNSDLVGIAPASTARSLKAGFALLVAAGVVAGVAHGMRSYLLGYAVSIIVALAAAFLSPAIGRLVALIARRTAARLGIAVRLGTDAFDRNTGRSAVAIAALGMALANVVNVGVFVESMKHSTLNWFERSVRADVFVFAGSSVQARNDHPLPADVGQALRRLPGVAFVDGFRMVRQRYGGQPIYVISHELDGYRKHSEFPVVSGNVDRALEEMAKGTAVAASESFAHEFKVGVGDKVTLMTPSGAQTFRVALIYVDYNTDLGVLCTTSEVYRRIWRDTLVDSYGVYLGKGGSAQIVRDAVKREWSARYRLMVVGNVEYKRDLLGLIDRTFVMTRATEFVAIIVAILGIVNTLLVSVIDRRMELGSLRAIGALRRQVGRMFMTEASLLGLAAALLGIAWGGLFSLYIVKELLPLQIGWQLTWKFSATTMLETLLLAQVVSVAGALWPMRVAANLDPTEALQYE